MLIPSVGSVLHLDRSSLSRGMNANSQPVSALRHAVSKSIKRDEC